MGFVLHQVYEYPKGHAHITEIYNRNVELIENRMSNEECTRCAWSAKVYKLLPFPPQIGIDIDIGLS
jgi:hypothetical protein